MTKPQPSLIYKRKRGRWARTEFAHSASRESVSVFLHPSSSYVFMCRRNFRKLENRQKRRSQGSLKTGQRHHGAFEVESDAEVERGKAAGGPLDDVDV